MLIEVLVSPLRSASRVRLLRRRGSSRGQAMLEFALVLPFFFVLLFGVMDGCLLVFSVGSSQFAVAQGAKAAAQSGNATTPEDADHIALDAVRNVIGPTAIIKVTKVEIYELTPDAFGQLQQVPGHINTYLLDGTLFGPLNWPPSARKVSNSDSSYIGVKLHYSYTLHAAFLPNTLPSDFTASSQGRVEPATY